MDEGSTLYRGGHVARDDWAALLEAGAVGNTNTRFFDAAGRPVALLDDRTIAISWDQLRAIRTVVAIAAGVERAAAIRGALATGGIDILVTDEATAEAMLGTDGPAAGRPRSPAGADRLEAGHERDGDAPSG